MRSLRDVFEVEEGFLHMGVLRAREAEQNQLESVAHLLSLVWLAMGSVGGLGWEKEFSPFLSLLLPFTFFSLLVSPSTLTFFSSLSMSFL